MSFIIKRLHTSSTCIQVSESQLLLCIKCTQELLKKRKKKSHPRAPAKISLGRPQESGFLMVFRPLHLIHRNLRVRGHSSLFRPYGAVQRHSLHDPCPSPPSFNTSSEQCWPNQQQQLHMGTCQKCTLSSPWTHQVRSSRHDVNSDPEQKLRVSGCEAYNFQREAMKQDITPCETEQVY